MTDTPIGTDQRPPQFSFPILRRGVMQYFAGHALPSTKLTVVTAPPGYGKTILLTALFRHYEEAGNIPVWIDLDESAESVEHLLSLLEQALSAVQPAHQGTGMIHVSDALIEYRIEDLLGRIRASAQPMVLIIDNISYVKDDTLPALLGALMDRTPDSFHLVVAGTRELPMGLTRMELAGLVTRVGYRELAFTLAEIQSAFGEELCAALGSADLHRIYELTEGWPAAVRLMQILLRDSENPRATVAGFSGSDKNLADMLNRGVLARFESGVRQFLYEIAPLRKFCVAQCRQATGNQAAADYIEELLANQFFVVPVDRNRKWYRLHGLLRQFLLAEAETEISAERQRQVLAGASEWCEENGQWADAIEYSLMSRDKSRAASIIDRVPARFVRDLGGLKSYIHWVEVLDASGVALSWEARYWYVWALVFHRRYELASRKIGPLEDQILGSRDVDKLTAEERERLTRLEIIRVTVDFYLDQLTQAVERARNWLDNTPNPDPFDVATLSSACGIAHTANLDFVSARSDFNRARASINQADSDYGEIWVRTLSHLPLLAEGEFLRAHEGLRQTLDDARRLLGDRAGMTGTVALVAANAAVEIGAGAEARRWIDLGFPTATTHGILDSAACGIDAALKLWSTPCRTSLSIDELRDVVAGYPARLGYMFSCWLIRRYLGLGRLDDAYAELDTLGADRVGSELDNGVARLSALWAMTQIDLDIAAGRLKSADARISAQTALAKQAGCHGRLVELALAEMKINVASSDLDRAVRSVSKAVRHAAKRGFIRPFHEQSVRLAAVINETRAKSWGFAQSEEREFFAEVCRGLPTQGNKVLDQLEEMEVSTALLEQPTPRELELLALIEAGLSNQQLADRLSVSVATVKWHLYNLYQKLGVSSRAAAIARARALHLLT